MWCDDCAAPFNICDSSLVFAISGLLDPTAIDSVSWRLVWPRAVLVTAKIPSVRGVSVFDLGALVFLVYPLGSVAVLTRCNIVSDRLMDQ